MNSSTTDQSKQAAAPQESMLDSNVNGVSSDGHITQHIETDEENSQRRITTGDALHQREIAEQHPQPAISTGGATIKAPLVAQRRHGDDQRSLLALRLQVAASNAELSNVVTKTDRANLNLKNLDDQAEIMERKVAKLEGTLSALSSAVDVSRQSEAALQRSIHDLRIENADLVKDTDRNREFNRRFRALHQAQLGGRWREDRVLQQRRQAQETLLTNREQAVAAAEEQLRIRQEEIAAAGERLVELRTAWERTSSYHREVESQAAENLEDSEGDEATS
ncbi:hypothetical protein EDC01DRAFT_630724 [Geopyxis carbonaria]|nr:hypothetical protein EDC01DRAFT_630724 [Geopyxis carbonaria]